MKGLIIVGAGGHSRPIIATALLQGRWCVSGVVDISFYGQKETILDIPVLGGLKVIETFDPTLTDVFIAIGNNDERRGVYNSLEKKGYQFPSIVHPTAFICDSAVMGKGNYVGPFAHLGPNVCVGNGNILNTSANLEHEVRVEDFSQVAPNAVICGRSQIGSCVFIGANATVIEQLVITHGTVIGAGSVIVKDVLEPNKKFVGVPGRII